jgi:hypothetical protein
MESDDRQKKDFDFEVPVVASRREFFEQEAIFIDEPDEAEPYTEPEDPVEDLKKMREEAAKRTRKGEGLTTSRAPRTTR